MPLARTLRLTSAVALVIGITIGSGIFRSPAGVAARAPDPLVTIGLWVLGGLITLCGALSFAELAAAFPETGGYYVYLREAWGRPTAFVFGWAQLVLIRASALGSIAIVSAEYTLRAFDIDPGAHLLASRSLAAAELAIAAAVNVVGIDVGAAVVRVSTFAKFIALAVLIAVSFALGGAHGGTVQHIWATASEPVTATGMGLGLVSVLWAYDGFGDVSYNAGEIATPQRTLPLAIIGGTVVIIIAYVFANLAYLYVHPVESISQSKLVAADTMMAIFGAPGAVMVSALVAVSAFGSLNGLMLSSPRVFFAMANDGLFFRSLARVHKQFNTPHVAILLSAALGMTLVFSRSFEALTGMFVIAIWPFYALSIAGLFRLRRLQPALPRPYRVVGYPIVPAVFVLAVVAFLGNALISDTLPTILTLGLIVAGIPVYALRSKIGIDSHLPARSPR